MLLRTLLLTILFSLACLHADAGVFSERYFKDSSHPGKCVIQGHVVSPGQSIKHPVMQCGQFSCDNPQGMATIETCDPVHALASPLTMLKDYDPKDPPKCTWGEFSSPKAPYPQCCQRSFSCVL